ncbi:MAG TPA: M20/M25/M40 family metallo-hydrolase [Acidobacteriota bacterium]|nr:M20/M25/M40 family metallo-hydrolase [Acidobacteriota bacterium]
MAPERMFASEQARIELLETLVNIPSLTGSEGEVGRHLERLLEKIGFRVQRQFVDSERFNVIATTAKPPKLLFCTHMDTVRPHFNFSREGEILYGRGVCDAKGSMTAMIAAAEELIRRGHEEIGLLFVVGEELDSDGAKKAAELDLDPNYIILGEPTENTVAIAQKGTLVFRVRSSGQPGHSAYPRGPSAIHILVGALNRLTLEDWGQDPTLGETTLNIGRIEGGEGPNVVAASAVAEGIFRVAGSVEEIMDRLARILGSELELDILSSSEPVFLTSVEGIDETVVSFGSDAPYLQELGKVVLMGPGSIQNAHRPDETIQVPEITRASENYCAVAMQLLTE